MRQVHSTDSTNADIDINTNTDTFHGVTKPFLCAVGLEPSMIGDDEVAINEAQGNAKGDNIDDYSENCNDSRVPVTPQDVCMNAVIVAGMETILVV